MTQQAAVASPSTLGGLGLYASLPRYHDESPRVEARLETTARLDLVRVRPARPGGVPNRVLHAASLGSPPAGAGPCGLVHQRGPSAQPHAALATGGRVRLLALLPRLPQVGGGLRLSALRLRLPLPAGRLEDADLSGARAGRGGQPPQPLGDPGKRRRRGDEPPRPLERLSP